MLIFTETRPRLFGPRIQTQITTQNQSQEQGTQQEETKARQRKSGRPMALDTQPGGLCQREQPCGVVLRSNTAKAKILHMIITTKTQVYTLQLWQALKVHLQRHSWESNKQLFSQKHNTTPIHYAVSTIINLQRPSPMSMLSLRLRTFRFRRFPKAAGSVPVNRNPARNKDEFNTNPYHTATT